MPRRAEHPPRAVPDGILEPGRNCWRVGRARRVSFLRDGEAYFRAATEAMAQARRSILLLSWDVDSQVEVNRHGVDGLPSRLGELLRELVERRRALQVHILSWDFAAVFALEREALPAMRLDWGTHERIHLFLDDRHPTGASHHQKILVVDDAVAFVGGLDITRQRWDQPGHDPGLDARRDHSKPEGYAPFHDVQALVDGDCARSLGQLARERWRVATGERLGRAHGERDPWPPSVPASLLDVDVGIARTVPAFEDEPEIREVESLYLDEIAAARQSLYVENQYFTSRSVVAALETSLQRPDGPEVVIVLPRTSSGWLEEATMGQLRSRAILRLREADRHDRLRIVHPGGASLGDVRVNVHSKVLIADGAHVRVGSSNLSNRSMGFDSECDVAVDAHDEGTRQGIAHFRGELLGEHLGLPAGVVARRLAQHGGSLVKLIDSIGPEQPRALVPLQAEEPSWLGALEPAIELADPSRPARRGPARRRRPLGLLVKWGLVALVLGALTLLWTATPLRDWLRPQRLAEWAGHVKGEPLALVGFILAHALAGLLAVPVTLLILGTMLAFGPWWGSALALAGCLANAASGYGIGRWLGTGAERWFRDRFPSATSLLRRHGALSLALVRLVPVAPYTLVNLAAGALRVPFRAYMVGTALGLLPGIALLALLGDGLRQAIEDPGPRSFLTIAVAVVAWIAGAAYLRRRMRRSGGPEGTAEGGAAPA